MRMIPGKTKVKIELFRGVSLSDILVGILAVLMLSFTLTSSIPGKYFVAVAVILLFILLLTRINGEPNYLYLLHILRHYGYRRRYERRASDASLTREAPDPASREQLESMLFHEGDTALSAKERKRRAKEEKALRKLEEKKLKSRKVSQEEKNEILEARAEREARQARLTGESPEEDFASEEAPAKPTRAERKAKEKEKKEREKLRKLDEKKLKRGDTPPAEREAILRRQAEEKERRNRELIEFARKQAEDKDAGVSRHSMEDIVPFTEISGSLIHYGKHYSGAVIEIPPVEFRFFSANRRAMSIEQGVGKILRNINPEYAANIVKLERPVLYGEYLEKEKERLAALRSAYESGLLKEDEFQTRVGILYDRIYELKSFDEEDKVVVPFYYIVLFESDRRQLEMQVSAALDALRMGELNAHRLDDKELAVFLRYSNSLDFDEREIDKVAPEDYAQWAMPKVVDISPRRVMINRIVTHNFRVANYPTVVGDAWLAGVFSMPGTKCVIKCKPMDRAKAIRSIDHSLMELRGQYASTGIESKQMELATHIETLSQLLATLQQDNETLLEVNIYVTAYDIAATRASYKLPQPPESSLINVSNMKRSIRRLYQESGMRLNNMEFDQVPAFVASQISGWDPFHREGRGIPSNTVAAAYPWIYANISDKGGFRLGSSDGVPVFIDFFRRDNERVNSNMVIVGKSGSGKSYATKTLLSNLAADDAKIFILDPENEYTDLSANLKGKFINVGNASQGRLNPFHIITALDDDEGGQSAGNSYATHLQFLEEFFAQALPDCEKDALEYLNSLVDRMYRSKGIDAETDLSRLKPEDYPVFDDLYDTILMEFQRSKNDYIRSMLRILMNYVAKFSTGGRNAVIWNGPSSVTTEENFVVFNFQSLLANRNTTIANAQMLLVLKYIDNEIIKNRDYNRKYGLNRKIVVVIDEAHVFIDAKYPAALDFMFQLAKRIRKYNGMQIVITQNIKDFVGSEELARKSTAIINACQYSLIFSLAPDDMGDLCTLYEKAGGINENEQEQIISAVRGQAFAILGPASRTSFKVETPKGIETLFSTPDYRNEYFFGEQGSRAWDEFLGNSREVREAHLAQRLETAEKPMPAAEEEPFDLSQFSLVEMEEIEEEPETGELLEIAEISEEGVSDRLEAADLQEEREIPSRSIEKLLSQMDFMGKFSYEAIMAEVQREVQSQLAKMGLSGEGQDADHRKAPSRLAREPEELEPVWTAPVEEPSREEAQPVTIATAEEEESAQTAPVEEPSRVEVEATAPVEEPEILPDLSEEEKEPTEEPGSEETSEPETESESVPDVWDLLGLSMDSDMEERTREYSEEETEEDDDEAIMSFLGIYPTGSGQTSVIELMELNGESVLNVTLEDLKLYNSKRK